MASLSTAYGRPKQGEALALYPSVDRIPDWRPRVGAGDFVPRITPMFPEGRVPASPRGMVIVAPGGGYGVRAPHEGAPIAEVLNRAGWVSAVLDYRTVGECEAPLRYGPLADAQRAVRLVRAHAGAWGVRPDRIALLGSSAGGHLTGCAGVHYDAGDPNAADPAERVSSRLDAMVLLYAVVNGLPGLGHAGSITNLLGEDPTSADADFMNNPAHVTPDTPPAFFFHTADDGSVPVNGAFAFAAELSRAKVPFGMHIYPHGPHGVGLALDRPALADWPNLLVDWLREMDF